MGLRMYCPEEAAPIPKPVWLELTCDGAGCHATFVCCENDEAGGCMGCEVTGRRPDCAAVTSPGRHTFKDDGYIAQRRAATAAGWKVTGEGKVYGPCCRKQ